MEHRQVQTEHRLVQLSKAVEEVLQETINLLGAAEDEDLQPSRQVAWPARKPFASPQLASRVASAHARLFPTQTFQQSRAHFDALLYTHRHANGATESLQMDLVRRCRCACVCRRRCRWCGCAQPRERLS